MKQFIKALPVLSIVLALALDALLPDNLQHPAAEHPYFTWLLIAALVLYLIVYIASFARPALREKLEYKALFYAGAVLFFNILNLLTVKFAVLPVLYFPSLDRVFGVLVEDSTFLAKCLAYSARLLLIGWFCGALVGMLTGIAIGFSKTFSYWVQPLVRVLGPIPSTAWIPIVLIALSLRRLRQRIPDRARRMVPDHRSHEQRHRLHPPTRTLRSPRRSAPAAFTAS